MVLTERFLIGQGPNFSSRGLWMQPPFFYPLTGCVSCFLSFCLFIFRNVGGKAESQNLTARTSENPEQWRSIE